MGIGMRPTDSAPVSRKMVAIRGNYKNEVVLRTYGPNHDLGYPATVECVLSAASARRKALSDDDALANLKIKVFTQADGHRHWVMLFDMVQHHPDRPAPYVCTRRHHPIRLGERQPLQFRHDSTAPACI